MPKTLNPLEDLQIGGLFRIKVEQILGLGEEDFVSGWKGGLKMNLGMKKDESNQWRSQNFHSWVSTCNRLLNTDTYTIKEKSYNNI